MLPIFVLFTHQPNLTKHVVISGFIGRNVVSVANIENKKLRSIHWHLQMVRLHSSAASFKARLVLTAKILLTNIEILQMNWNYAVQQLRLLQLRYRQIRPRFQLKLLGICQNVRNPTLRGGQCGSGFASLQLSKKDSIDWPFSNAIIPATKIISTSWGRNKLDGHSAASHGN